MRIMACVATSFRQTYCLLPAVTHFGDLRCEQFFEICRWKFASNARLLSGRILLKPPTPSVQLIANEATLHGVGVRQDGYIQCIGRLELRPHDMIELSRGAGPRT